MIAWCERLNSIGGPLHGPILLLQPHPGGGVESGHLWIQSDCDLSARFRDAALKLAADEALIERVDAIFEPWGEETVAITFKGNGKRPGPPRPVIANRSVSEHPAGYSEHCMAASLALHSLSNSPDVGLVYDET